MALPLPAAAALPEAAEPVVAAEPAAGVVGEDGVGAGACVGAGAGSFLEQPPPSAMVLTKLTKSMEIDFDVIVLTRGQGSKTAGCCKLSRRRIE